MRLAPGFLTLAIVLGLAGTVPGLSARQAPVRTTAAPVARYTISATLDPTNRLILGRGRVEWRNATLTPTAEIVILTPWNTRRDDRSTWANERRLAGPGRGQALLPSAPAAATADDARGFLDMTSLQMATSSGSLDLLARAAPTAPDDGNASDLTVWTIPLDEPIPPGRGVILEFAWNAHVPALEDGAGTYRDFFLIAGWFPRLAVLADDGWQAHQVHLGLGGFHDFSQFDVDLRLPTGWVVGATGLETGQQDHGDGSTTRRYRADLTSDFAWTTSPRFVERTNRVAEEGAPPVDVRLLLQPEHADQASRMFDAVKAVASRYHRWFNLTPSQPITIVDVPVDPRLPRASATAAAGHPGLLLIETRRFNPWAGADPETAIASQMGHQFWTAEAGPDPNTHGWLGAGVNAFVTGRLGGELFGGRVVVERYFGGAIAWPFSDVRRDRVFHGAHVAAYRRAAPGDALAAPTWRQHPAQRERDLLSRAPLVLVTLERLLGWETVQAILTTHHARGVGRHATPDEFVALASSASGRDLSWFFRATIDTGATFDYGVRSVSSVDADGGAVDSTIAVERLAAGVFPIDVRVTFNDGASVVERWDGREAWHAFTYRRAAEVVTVEVDPDAVLALDINRTNNSWTSRPRARQAADSWAIRWSLWFQHVLLTYAAFV